MHICLTAGGHTTRGSLVQYFVGDTGAPQSAGLNHKVLFMGHMTTHARHATVHSDGADGCSFV